MAHADSPSVLLRGPQGSSAQVFKSGAHVASWKTSTGEEILFVSKQAIFNPPKAIRGGVPVCFPQFGVLGSLSQHGFARNSMFTVASASEDTIALQYEPSEEDLSKYPHPFRLTITIHIGSNSLYQEMTVENTGSQSMEFTAALHTYYGISSVEKVHVKGLKGLQYFDNTDQGDGKVESEDQVTVNGEVDRIYRSAGNTLLIPTRLLKVSGVFKYLRNEGYIKINNRSQIEDVGNGRQVRVEKRGFPDAVLWNPWAAKSKGMSDFADDEYKEMICLEPALAKTGPKSLDPGGSWSASQTLTVSKL